MARPESGINALARIALGAGAAGFGWSAGRDSYRFLKKNFLVVAGVAACAGGAGYAAWDLSRGHPGGAGPWRIVRDAAIAVASSVLGSFVLASMARPGDAGGAALLALAAQAAAGLVGLAAGLAQRGRRTRAFAVEAHNVAFMRAAGLRDVGGNENTFLDGLGNELKHKDTREDAMVFSVHGRRNVRAYIDIDPTGRMTGYRPPA